MLDLTVEGSVARPKRNAERAALADRVSVGVNHLHDVPVAMTRRDLVVASGGLIETSPCDGGSFPAISAAPEDVAGCRIRRRRAPLARHPDRRIGDCRVKLGGTTFASMPVTAKMKRFELSVAIVQDRFHHPTTSDDLAFSVESQHDIDVGGGHLDVGVAETTGISSKFGHQISHAGHRSHLQIQELPRSDRLVMDGSPTATDSSHALFDIAAAT